MLMKHAMNKYGPVALCALLLGGALLLPLPLRNAFADEAPVAQVGDSQYTSFDEALSAWEEEENSTLELLQDVEVSNTITVNGEGKTLDLSSHKLTIQSEASASLLEVEGTLTVKGGTLTGGNADRGGGIYVDVLGNLTLENCTVSGNTAPQGGGVFVTGSLTLAGNTVVENNTATGNGGGIYSKGGTVIFQQGTIRQNCACRGGGMYFDNGKLQMCGGEISGNTAKECGGGISFEGSAETIPELDLSQGKVTENKAGYDGGGIYAYHCDMKIRGGEISGNTATGNGGGMYLSGEMHAEIDTANGEAGAVLIERNRADFFEIEQGCGGGIYVETDSCLRMKGGIVKNNRAIDGGGIYVDHGAEMAIENSEVVGNTAVGVEYHTEHGNGGGICLSDKGRIKICGNVIIKDNGGHKDDSNNLYLCGERCVEFNRIGEKTEIGITVDYYFRGERFVVCENISDECNAEDLCACFSSDRESFVINYNVAQKCLCCEQGGQDEI